VARAGLPFERKTLGAALHFRELPDRADAARAAAEGPAFGLGQPLGRPARMLAGPVAPGDRLGMPARPTAVCGAEAPDDKGILRPGSRATQAAAPPIAIDAAAFARLAAAEPARLPPGVVKAGRALVIGVEGAGRQQGAAAAVPHLRRGPGPQRGPAPPCLAPPDLAPHAQGGGRLRRHPGRDRDAGGP
jgi:hypothetical protein